MRRERRLTATMSPAQVRRLQMSLYLSAQVSVLYVLRHWLSAVVPRGGGQCQGQHRQSAHEEAISSAGAQACGKGS